MKKKIQKTISHNKVYFHLFLFFLGGFFLGYLVTTVFTQSNSNMDNHIHNDMEMHMHETFDASNYENKPSVNIDVISDIKSGYNVKILTNNFEFKPEMASLEHIDGQGHAHIYVNDIKISRVYSNWFYLDDLHSGDVVKVTLNTNDHKTYEVAGESVESIYVME